VIDDPRPHDFKGIEANSTTPTSWLVSCSPTGPLGRPADERNSQSMLEVRQRPVDKAMPHGADATCLRKHARGHSLAMSSSACPGSMRRRWPHVRPRRAGGGTYNGLQSCDMTISHPNHTTARRAEPSAARRCEHAAFYGQSDSCTRRAAGGLDTGPDMEPIHGRRHRNVDWGKIWGPRAYFYTSLGHHDDFSQP